MNILQTTWTVVIYDTVRNLLNRAPFSLLQSKISAFYLVLSDFISLKKLIFHHSAKKDLVINNFYKNISVLKKEP